MAKLILIINHWVLLDFLGKTEVAYEKNENLFLVSHLYNFYLFFFLPGPKQSF